MKHYKLPPSLVEIIEGAAKKHGLEFDDTDKFTEDDDGKECEAQLVSIMFPERDGIVHDLMIEACPNGNVYLLQLAHTKEGTPEQDTDIVWQDECEHTDEVVAAVDQFIAECGKPAT